MERKENGMPIIDRGAESDMMRDSLWDGFQLASVYAPMQSWRMIYPVDKALSHGTLFEELYKPLEVDSNG